jgi:hypothetical protein
MFFSGAPEVSGDMRRGKKGVSIITPGADIFSLGAVLSDAAGWVIGGRDFQQEYLQKRKVYHSNLRLFRGSGYDGCFHDGINSLPVIKEIHDHIRKHCSHEGWDTLTPQVVTIVQERMLLSKSAERDDAATLIKRFDTIMATEPLTRYVSLESVQETDSRDIRQLDQWRSQKKDGKVVDPAAKMLVDKIERHIRDRDQFFFIDDSTNMKTHSETVLQGFRALSYIAKKLDPNKIELAFASAPRCIMRAKKSTRLVKLVEKHDYRHDSIMMEQSMAELIDHEIITKLPYKVLGFNVHPFARKSVSIYVFTDGNWGDDKLAACGVERPIMRLMREVKRRELSRNQVSVHFVRFGDSENGSRHLQHLDKFGEELKW